MYSELTFRPKCTFFALLYFVFESGPRTFPRPRDWRSRSITGKRKMDLWSVIVLKFTRSCEDCRCTATQLLPIPAYMYHMYRVRHHVSDLGWVDLDVPLILPSCSASSATFPSAQAESGRPCNIQNQSQPNPGLIRYASPGTVSSCNKEKFQNALR